MKSAYTLSQMCNNLCNITWHENKIRRLGYERVYLPLWKVADTPFHIQGGDIFWAFIWCIYICVFYKNKITSQAYNAGIDFCRRQIMTTKVDPRAVRVKICLMSADPEHIGIQMNRKELTK